MNKMIRNSISDNLIKRLASPYIRRLTTKASSSAISEDTNERFYLGSPKKRRRLKNHTSSRMTIPLHLKSKNNSPRLENKNMKSPTRNVIPKIKINGKGGDFAIRPVPQNILFRRSSCEDFQKSDLFDKALQK